MKLKSGKNFYKSIQELPYVCPCCNKESKVDELTGHHLEAQCSNVLNILYQLGLGAFICTCVKTL